MSCCSHRHPPPSIGCNIYGMTSIRCENLPAKLFWTACTPPAEQGHAIVASSPFIDKELSWPGAVPRLVLVYGSAEKVYLVGDLVLLLWVTPDRDVLEDPPCIHNLQAHPGQVSETPPACRAEGIL